jgi:hypothetical protein
MNAAVCTGARHKGPINQQSFRGTLHNQTLRGFIDHDSFVDRDASAIPGSATVVAALTAVEFVGYQLATQMGHTRRRDDCGAARLTENAAVRERRRSGT